MIKVNSTSSVSTVRNSLHNMKLPIAYGVRTAQYLKSESGPVLWSCTVFRLKGYNCTRKFGFNKGRSSKRSKVLDIYIVELQSTDHWISYLVRNPCRFFTVTYKRLRLECFHFVNAQGNLTPLWKKRSAYLALGSRMWGAHKLPLIRQDQY